MYKAIFVTILLSFNVPWAQNIDTSNCSDLKRKTKYKVEKGDHVAAILRALNLQPVFGNSGSYKRFLALNDLQNPDLIEPNMELELPFQCEEEVMAWHTVERETDRLITRNQKLFVAKTELEPIKDESAQTLAIINSNDASTSAGPDSISEALRYRMICEGEWNGSECITRYSTLFASFGGSYNRYDGVDPAVTSNNKGLLLSRLNPTISLGWMNYWTENFSTQLSARFENSELLPEAREIPIESSSRTLLGSYQLGIKYEKGYWGVGLGYLQMDKIFYRFRFSGLSEPCLSPDASFEGCGVFAHTASIPTYYVSLDYLLYQAGKFRNDISLSYLHLGGAATGGFKINEGQGYSINYKITHDRVTEYLFGEINFTYLSQDTSIELQSMRHLGFKLGYAWKLKDW